MRRSTEGALATTLVIATSLSAAAALKFLPEASYRSEKARVEACAGQLGKTVFKTNTLPQECQEQESNFERTVSTTHSTQYGKEGNISADTSTKVTYKMPTASVYLGEFKPNPDRASNTSNALAAGISILTLGGLAAGVSLTGRRRKLAESNPKVIEVWPYLG